MQHPYVTHVTGIACGNGYNSHGKYTGIAKKSNIISLKILDKNGQGNSTQAISALRWIMDNAMKYNIKVVNLSIGTNDRKVNKPLMEAVNDVWNQGITVVAAASNPDSKRGFLPSPAISPKIITVGAWEDRHLFYQNKFSNNTFYKTEFSSPDIWAYGDNIISVLSPDYYFDLQNRDSRQIVDGNYIKMSGTSMATPMVSGAALLLLEKYAGILPMDIKERLLSAAKCQLPIEKRGLLNISGSL